MIKKSKYPILEFDDNYKAVINHFEIGNNNGVFDCDKLVRTFFSEVVDKPLAEGEILEYRFMKHEDPYTVYKFNNSDVLLISGQVGGRLVMGIWIYLLDIVLRK